MNIFKKALNLLPQALGLHTWSRKAVQIIIAHSS